jgi:hypothetical protein
VAYTWYSTLNSPDDKTAQLFATLSTNGGDELEFINPVQVSQVSYADSADELLQRGQSTGGNQPTTLNDTAKNWVPGYWTTDIYRVRIVAGKGVDQWATILSNTTNQLVLSNETKWEVVPDSTSVYVIEALNMQPFVGETWMPYGFDYGEYNGLAFHGGNLYPVWADNSNSTGDNPNGTRQTLDIYTSTVQVFAAAAQGMGNEQSATGDGTAGTASILGTDSIREMDPITIAPVTEHHHPAVFTGLMAGVMMDWPSAAGRVFPVGTAIRGELSRGSDPALIVQDAAYFCSFDFTEDGDFDHPGEADLFSPEDYFTFATPGLHCIHAPMKDEDVLTDSWEEVIADRL